MKRHKDAVDEQILNIVDIASPGWLYVERLDPKRPHSPSTLRPNVRWGRRVRWLIENGYLEKRTERNSRGTMLMYVRRVDDLKRHIKIALKKR